MLRYHLHLDPETLPEAVWAQTFAILHDIRQREAQNK